MSQDDLTHLVKKVTLKSLNFADISEISLLKGGGNNKVIKICLNTGKKYCLKIYYSSSSDNRDRMNTEFEAYKLLQNLNFDNHPKIIELNPEAGAGLFEFIEGEKVFPDNLSRKDIDASIAFISKLWENSKNHPQKYNRLASEAYFNLSELQKNLHQRIEILQDAVIGDLLVKNFITNQLLPHLELFNTRANKIIGSEYLPAEGRILSPSDFGFHNGLRRSDGSWVFFDFEYFGWDDPSKLISDFILHPGMMLSSELKSYFIRQIHPIFAGLPYFPIRLNAFFPLFGIKWSIILLNEFIPEYRARRGFSGSLSPEDLEIRLNNQLTKAQLMLDTIKNEYERFN